MTVIAKACGTLTSPSLQCRWRIILPQSNIKIRPRKRRVVGADLEPQTPDPSDAVKPYYKNDPLPPPQLDPITANPPSSFSQGEATVVVADQESELAEFSEKELGDKLLFLGSDVEQSDDETENESEWGKEAEQFDAENAEVHHPQSSRGYCAPPDLMVVEPPASPSYC
ncbi:hypothetical protein K470DRAFT_297221 [Piedraia hortae CBS 480.64]|uniref:Uncharacterized protein n=1 Tax=Piedraia hortae CBS 480.64 TaxID=1314780 RepID=A0A6A7BPF6_9PEZI|nr:hypothetical protein K470DRAFT_297221 [Piedraia hortae CBS 480.64]